MNQHQTINLKLKPQPRHPSFLITPAPLLSPIPPSPQSLFPSSTTSLLHRVSEECTVRGYTIPKDTMVIPHLDAALFDDKFWGDPHTFRPERFLNSKGDVVQPDQFIVYSLGESARPVHCVLFRLVSQTSSLFTL